MIKIVFEVNEEDLFEERLKEMYLENTNIGTNHFSVIFIGAIILKRQISLGKKEFIITKNKLDSKSIEIYDGIIGAIFNLAAFSETDKVKNKEDVAGGVQIKNFLEDGCFET